MIGAGVLLVPSDPAWPARFAREAERLRAAAGEIPVTIEHIGSTAVPKLLAKPTIDILVGAGALEPADELVPRFEKLGYVYVKAYEEKLPMRRFLRTGSRTHNLHVVEKGGAFWQEHVAFRDWLRTHPDDVRRYAFLKQQLVQRFGSDRDRYTEAKAPFIAEILREAMRR